MTTINLKDAVNDQKDKNLKCAENAVLASASKLTQSSKIDALLLSYAAVLESHNLLLSMISSDFSDKTQIHKRTISV